MRKVLLLLALTACEASSTDASPGPSPSSQPTTAPTSSAKPAKDGGAADAGPHGASDALKKCAESKGELASITDAVTRMNAISGKGGDGDVVVEQQNEGGVEQPDVVGRRRRG